MKALVDSPYSIFSGYGGDGIGITRALLARGHDVYVRPTWVDVPIPPDILPLFSKPLIPPFDLTIKHCSPDQLDISREARECTRLAVAWSMWEFGSLRHLCKNRSSLRKRLKWFDLMLAYDPVSLQSLEPYLPPHVARGILLGGFEAGNWKYTERDWFGDQFGFFMHGALNNRKQPYLVLQAHLELREEDEDYRNQARLSFHTTTPPLFPELQEILNRDGDKRVRIFYETWDEDYLRAFYSAQHCAVYPSWGEGKNLPCLEFLATGGTVIHTFRGGPQLWLNDAVGYTVPHKLMPLLPKYPDGPSAARVELADLKAQMLHVFRNRGEARERGRLGADLIPKQLDWSVVVEDLFRRIKDQCGEHGERIWGLAQEDVVRRGSLL